MRLKLVCLSVCQPIPYRFLPENINTENN